MTTQSSASFETLTDPVDALLFDMDGTLIDSTAVTKRVWGRWAEKRGLESKGFIERIHGIRAVDVLRGLNLQDVDPVSEARKIEEAEMNDITGIVPVPGAIELLQSLPRERWAIVTSAPLELARRRMQAAGVPFADIVVSGEDVARGKPDPACYILGASRLGFDVGNCVVFEDAPAGIAAADAAGASLVVITFTHAGIPVAGRRCIADFRGIRATSGADHRLSLRLATP